MASPSPSMVVKDKLESYFENANSTSRRMMVDISDFKKKVNWNYMNENQQADFLWENLIGTKTQSAYGDSPRPSNDAREIFTTLRVNPGEKIVIDEDTSNGRPFGCSWRDEHSAPFSWHTKSQLDLRLLDDEVDQPIKTHSPPKNRKVKNLPEIPIDKNQIIVPPSSAPARPKKGLKPIDTPKRRPPPPPPPQTPKITPPPCQKEAPPSKNPPSSTPKLILAGGTLVMIQEPPFEDEPPKPKTPIVPKERPKEPPKLIPPTVPVMLPSKVATPVRESVLSMDDLDKNIPKTGFDFLDNW